MLALLLLPLLCYAFDRDYPFIRAVETMIEYDMNPDVLLTITELWSNRQLHPFLVVSYLEAGGRDRDALIYISENVRHEDVKMSLFDAELFDIYINITGKW